MALNTGDKLHGFTVTRIRNIEEIEGQLVEMTHDRTGAGLVWADNGEENKLFSVGFRTLPEDSTGVFHILEHSVLCGSSKYPVKEPFVELLKTSMNTFLNAMTYSDKTLYPVSSKIEQDYINLMGVYLDAVFCPIVLSNPNIFYQEGWHIDTADEAPAFKGVVFNEMKGAMSDVDQVAERELLRLLFPDTCYGFNSGGDPASIPDLTYEDFIRRYHKFYHPSNSYFYLDGDIPLDKTLGMIDSYLAKYDRLENIPQIEMQSPVTSDDVCIYEAGNENDKPMIIYGRITGTWEDRQELLALSVLTEQLADSNESPLKRAILSSGLAEDMEIYISDGIAQPYMVILFRGIDASSVAADGMTKAEAVRAAGDKLLEIVRNTTNDILEKGIPEEDLTASINQMDFRFRQYPEPQGLYRANVVLNSWLYGGDPALYLKTNEAISLLRKEISQGAAQKLAREFFVNTDSYTRVTLLPSVTLGEERAAEEAARVASIVSAMDDKQKASLEELNEKLLRWQETPDSDEALATIPQIELSDISSVPELISTEVTEKDGVTILYHKLPSNGIIYINAYFPLADLTLEELPAAALITEFYKDLPTENYSVTALQNRLRTYVGSMSFGVDVNAVDSDRTSCTPCLRARAAVLEENLSYAEELIIEIMTRTKFDDRELIRELVTQIDDEGKRYAVSSGHRIAISAARSQYSARDAAAEAINGYTFLQYMHKINSDFDECIDGFTEFAGNLVRRSVVKADAVFSVTASEPVDLGGLIGMLPEGNHRPAKASYTTPLPKRLGISIPASVSHAICAYDLARIGRKPAGSLSVVSNILSLAHLWNEIRVKGGAYGASVSASRTGNMFCYSFRDPSPERSLQIYGTIPEFIDAFAGQGEIDLDGFIISSVASTEPLISVSAKGRSADDFWFSGFTDEDRIRVRGEILGTTAADLLSWKEAFEHLAKEGSVCVIGPKAALEKCDDLEIVQ